MFDFKALAEIEAVGKELAKAEQNADSQNKQLDQDKMSQCAMNAVRRSIVAGIIKSLSMHLFETVPDPKDQKAKVLTVLNAMKASGDIDENEAKWCYNDYFTMVQSASVASDPDCPCAPCSMAYMSWWSVISNLLDDTHVYEWSFKYDDQGNDVTGTLNADEKELVESYRTISQAYYSIRSRFESYFREVNKRSMTQLLIKYGTVLSQVDASWYKEVCRGAGVTNDDKE